MILYDRPRKIFSEFNIPSEQLNQAKKKRKKKDRKIRSNFWEKRKVRFIAHVDVSKNHEQHIKKKYIIVQLEIKNSVSHVREIRA